MKLVTDIYGKDPLTKEVLKTYFLLLLPYSITQVRDALNQHLKKSVYLPKPADIITLIEGTVEDRAKLAWQYVVKAIRRYGRSANVRFPNPAYHFAIERMGGWWRLCATLREDDLPFRGKDFERFFEIGEKTASWDDEPGKVQVKKYLGGYYERERDASCLMIGQGQVYCVETGEIIKNHEVPVMIGKKTSDVDSVIGELAKRMKKMA
jgi:hypothetical protein